MDQWIGFWTALWVGSSRITHWAVDWLCNAKTPPPAPAPVKPKTEEPADEPDTDAGETDTGETDEQPRDTGEQPKTPKKTKEKPPPKAAAEGSALLRWVGLLITAVVSKTLPYTTNIAIGAATAWVLTSLVLGYAAAVPPEEEKKNDQPTEGGQEQQEQPDEELPHPSETMTLDHVAQLLHTVYTEGSGVHLAALAEHLTGAPFMGHPAAPWATRDVRALLARHEVRIRPGVRVPPVGGREGVHKDDFPPLPQPPSEAPVVGVVVPGQRNNNNPGNSSAPLYRITADPDNPVRHHVHHTP